MLAAVALLGSDMPAVLNLNDILAMYGIKDFGQIKIYAGVGNDAIVKTHQYIPTDDKGNEMPKTEAELKLELELKTAQDLNKTLADQATAHKADLTARDSELATLRTASAAAEKRANDEAALRAETELNASIDQMTSEKLITPAMKPFMKELLGAHKAEYSVAGKEGEKKFSRTELVKQILKLHTASDVNVDESSEEGQVPDGNSDKVLNEKIEKFMEENKCSYKAAYKAVVKVTSPRASV